MACWGLVLLLLEQVAGKLAGENLDQSGKQYPLTQESRSLQGSQGSKHPVRRMNSPMTPMVGFRVIPTRQPHARLTAETQRPQLGYLNARLRNSEQSLDRYPCPLFASTSWL